MSGSEETIRAFFAIDLSDSVRQAVADAIRALREAAPAADVGWVDVPHTAFEDLGVVPVLGKAYVEALDHAERSGFNTHGFGERGQSCR